MVWCNGIGINYNDYVKNNSLDQLKLLEVDGVVIHWEGFISLEGFKELPFQNTSINGWIDQ